MGLRGHIFGVFLLPLGIFNPISFLVGSQTTSPEIGLAIFVWIPFELNVKTEKNYVWMGLRGYVLEDDIF